MISDSKTIVPFVIVFSLFSQEKSGPYSIIDGVKPCFI